jgi:hypothetical protein
LLAGLGVRDAPKGRAAQSRVSAGPQAPPL